MAWSKTLKSVLFPFYVSPTEYKKEMCMIKINFTFNSLIQAWESIQHDNSRGEK